MEKKIKLWTGAHSQILLDAGFKLINGGDYHHPLLKLTLNVRAYSGLSYDIWAIYNNVPGRSFNSFESKEEFVDNLVTYFDWVFGVLSSRQIEVRMDVERAQACERLVKNL